MKKYQKIILAIWPFLVFALFRFNGINQNICKMTQFVTVAVTLLYLSNTFLCKFSRNSYPYLVRWQMISVVISIFMSYIAWQQSIVLSFRVTCIELSVIYFFLLYKWQPSLEYVEKIALTYGVVNLVLWMMAMAVAPMPLFGGIEEEMKEPDRGVYRINILGNGFFLLTFFYSVVRFKMSSKMIWLVIAVLLYVIIVMHVVRQIIAFTLITAIMYYFWNRKWRAAIFIFIFYVFSNVISFKDALLGNKVMSAMIEQTEKQYDSQKSGEDDIRVREYIYFFAEFPTTPLTAMFGNGTPHSEGPFGKMAEYYMGVLRMFPSDVGYAAIYHQHGILGLIILLCLLIMVIRQKVPNRWMYIKLFILYQIPANIAASWFVHDTMTIATCYYILYRLQIQSNQQNLPYKI